MDQIKYLAKNPIVEQALLSLKGRKNELVKLIINVQQISAPTFQEEKRAIFVEKRFSALGLKDVHRDAINNVFARLPGSANDTSSPLIISAHSDTVFSASTDLKIKRDGYYLRGPGIGDNSTGVASLLYLAKLMLDFSLVPNSDIWFVVNVGEEGMGNLCGMRAVVKRFGGKAHYIVVEGGSFGQIIYKAIGVKRFRIAINTNGGHSWGDFGQPNAIHELGKLIAEISQLSVPYIPKTTYNVGVIEGGTTVNSIAASASLLLDLRSEEESTLDQLVEEVFSLVKTKQQKETRSDHFLAIKMEEVGNRPPGAIPSDHKLVRMAEMALDHVGWTKVSNTIGSTDANIPLSQNIPCVCVGITMSDNSHRLDEYIDLRFLEPGMQQLLLLVLAVSNSNL